MVGGIVEGRLDLHWDKIMDPDIRVHTQRVAMDALREEVRRGFDPQPVVVTDGVPRRAPEQVRAYGRIEWVARANAVEVATWVNAQLFRLSPVLTGQYRRSHIWMLNGEQVQNFNRYQPGDRIQIVSPAPYAKKLEGRPASSRAVKGKGRERVAGVRGLSKQAPQGVYRVVHRWAQQRFGRALFIDFKYVTLNTGVQVWGYQGGGKNRKRIRRAHVYPAIQIYVKPN